MISPNLTFSVSENTPTSMANCIQCLSQRYFTQNTRLVCSTCQICFWVLRKCDLILNLEVLCISDSNMNSLALLCTTGVVHYITLFSDFFLKNSWNWKPAVMLLKLKSSVLRHCVIWCVNPAFWKFTVPSSSGSRHIFGLLNPEDEGTVILRNFRNHSSQRMGSQSKWCAMDKIQQCSLAFLKVRICCR
jgi:hypothetical protein